MRLYDVETGEYLPPPDEARRLAEVRATEAEARAAEAEARAAEMEAELQRLRAQSGQESE